MIAGLGLFLLALALPNFQDWRVNLTLGGLGLLMLLAVVIWLFTKGAFSG